MRQPVSRKLPVLLAGLVLLAVLPAALSTNIVYLKLLKGEGIPVQWLELARFLQPGSSSPYLAAARERINQGQEQEALEILLEASQKTKFDPQLHFQIGNLYAGMGSEAEAVEHWRKAGAWRYFQTQAVASEAEGDIAGALENYLRSLSINSDRPEGWAQAGRLYEKLGKNEEAAGAWGQAALNYLDDSIEKIWAEGESQRLSGRWAEAEQSYRKGLSLAPEDTRFHIHLAYTCYYGYHDLECALEEVEHAISILPENYWYYIELGNFLHFEGRFSEAETWYQRAIDRGKQGACEAMAYILDDYEQVRRRCAVF